MARLQPITISDGETESEAIETKSANGDSKCIVGLYFGTLSSATDFSLKISPDGTTYYPVLDPSDGSLLSFTLLASGVCYIPIDPSYTYGAKYAKIVMAGAVSADRTVIPVTQLQS